MTDAIDALPDYFTHSLVHDLAGRVASELRDHAQQQQIPSVAKT